MEMVDLEFLVILVVLVLVVKMEHQDIREQVDIVVVQEHLAIQGLVAFLDTLEVAFLAIVDLE